MEKKSSALETAGWWDRFWYFAAWRFIGICFIGGSIRVFQEGQAAVGGVFIFMGITYLVMLPHALLTMFRFGYSMGCGDTLAYTVTGEQEPLRAAPHPADAHNSQKRWRTMF